MRICRYADADTRIRIRGYGYADADTRIRICGYGYRVSGVRDVHDEGVNGKRSGGWLGPSGEVARGM